MIAGAIAAGVLWSNGLAYSNVWLAPRTSLGELQKIGNRFAGDGPTLITQYQPYAVRHFLRRMDPEAPSERRRRLVPLLNGQGLDKGLYADLDRFQLGGILVYKTLVLPHSPVASRPTSAYQLVWSGRYYDVWQRPNAYPTIVEHLPLGDAHQPAAVPACSQVLSIAQRAGPDGRLVAAPRRAVTAVALSGTAHPEGWSSDANGLLYANGPGDATTTVRVARRGTYRLWLGGSFRDRLRVYVDGRLVADERYRLADDGTYDLLGTAFLSRGTHAVRLRFSGPDLRPGSGGYPFGTGPLVLSRAAPDPPLVTVDSSHASSLCRRRLDWVDALGATTAQQ